MPSEQSRVRPILRLFSVVSAVLLAGLYVLQAQQSANPPDEATRKEEARKKEEERKKLPAMAPGSKALAPPISERVFAPSSKRGAMIVPKATPTPEAKPRVVAPSSKLLVIPSTKSGDLTAPFRTQGTPVPELRAAPSGTPTPAATVTPAPSPTPTK